jgi:hypothetical protein
MAAQMKLAYFDVNPLTDKSCAYTLDESGKKVMIGQAANKADLLARLDKGKLPKAIKLNVVKIVDIAEYKRLNGQPATSDIRVFDAQRQENPTAFAPVDDTPVVKRIAFSLQEKFRFYALYTDMVLGRNSRAMVVPGPPGVGKSFLLKQALKRYNLKDCRAFVDQAKEDEKHISLYGDYIIFKGKMTPKAFFRILFEYRKNIIVLDDCDILDDPDVVNVAKGALDNGGDGMVTWATNKSGEMRDMDLPETFKFEGKVINLTNLKASQLDSAIRSRAWIADLWGSVEEIFGYMRGILAGPTDLGQKYTKKEIFDALDCMYENRAICSEVSFRMLEQCVEVRHVCANEDWQRIVQHVIQTPV